MPRVTINVSNEKKDTLRYYMHNGSAAFSFELAGNLSREGARELEQAWRTACSVIGGRDLIVDRSFVTGMDEAGRELLNKWHAQGARLVAISAEATSRLQSRNEAKTVHMAAFPDRGALVGSCLFIFGVYRSI